MVSHSKRDARVVRRQGVACLGPFSGCCARNASVLPPHGLGVPGLSFAWLVLTNTELLLVRLGSVCKIRSFVGSRHAVHAPRADLPMGGITLQFGNEAVWAPKMGAAMSHMTSCKAHVVRDHGRMGKQRPGERGARLTVEACCGAAKGDGSGRARAGRWGGRAAPTGLAGLVRLYSTATTTGAAASAAAAAAARTATGTTTSDITNTITTTTTDAATAIVPSQAAPVPPPMSPPPPPPTLS